jgi:hypothetical protein
MRLLCLASLAVAAVLPPAATASAAAPPPGARGQVLFVQNATSGTYAGGKLTLFDVSPRTAWFSDRPQRRSGTVPVATLRGALFGGGGPAPNAALDLGARGVVALELRGARYDREARTMTYRAKPIGRLSRPGLRHLSGRVTRRPPPRTFGPAALFVDDATTAGKSCQVSMVNFTGLQLDAIAATTSSTDRWSPQLPVGSTVPDSKLMTWGSTGGASLGCRNEGTWRFHFGAQGTVTIAVTNPWTGTPSTTCVSSDPYYGCRLLSSATSGTTFTANWLIVAEPASSAQ